jgi:putative addiction module component (TIGR02574 family)
MNVDQTIADLSNLSIDERVRIVKAIWDTLPDDADLGLSAEQQAELDRRLAEHEADPLSAISHDELLRRIASRF